MRSRTLLVPARRAPRPTAHPLSATPRLSAREMDMVMFVYETYACLAMDETESETETESEIQEFIPASAAALNMYYLARRVHVLGLLDMETTTRPNAEDGYNPHHHPTHYAWTLRLTRKGQECVAHHLAQSLPSPALNTADYRRPYRWGATA